MLYQFFIVECLAYYIIYVNILPALRPIISSFRTSNHLVVSALLIKLYYY